MAQEAEVIDFGDFAVQLERVFDQVGQDNQPVLINRDGELYRLEKEKQENAWHRYDPERVKQALAASAGALQGVDVEKLLSDLDAQREQGPGRFEYSGRST